MQRRLRLTTLTIARHRALSVSLRPHTSSPRQTVVPVDEFCIPLSPPYSISSFIPSPTPLTRAALTKLHTLSALNPPTTEEGWTELEQLGGLVAIMEGVRLPATGQAMDDGARDSNGVVLVDGRVRDVAASIGRARDEGEQDEQRGREIMKLASFTQGGYYVVRTPDGIRGKKKTVH